MISTKRSLRTFVQGYEGGHQKTTYLLDLFASSLEWSLGAGANHVEGDGVQQFGRRYLCPAVRRRLGELDNAREKGICRRVQTRKCEDNKKKKQIPDFLAVFSESWP